MERYTCDQLVEFSRKFAPQFLYDKRESGEDEEFFPINIESWLTHEANWDGGAGHCAEPMPDRPQRGSSIWDYETSPGSGWAKVHPGQIHLSPATADPDDDQDFVGNEVFKNNPKHFVNFGSWIPCPSNGSVPEKFINREECNREYDFQIYDRARPVSRPEGMDPQWPESNPSMNPDYPPSLTCYCEVERGADLLQIALSEVEEFEGIGLPDVYDQQKYQPLSDYLVFTYYFFYPVMQPFKQGKFMEGQWEAVSIFVKEQGHKEHPIPRFVVYSQSYDHNVDGWWIPKQVAQSVEANDLLKMDGNHPIAYVSWGSHGNYFDPKLNPVKTEPEDQLEWYEWGMIGGWVLCAYGIATGNVYAAVAGAIIFAICWIIALIASLCGGDDEESEERSYQPESTVDETHNGDGPAVTTPGSDTPSPPPDQPQVSFTLRNIDRTDEGAIRVPPPQSVFAEDPEDPPNICEYPFWWDFTGRWGVMVDPNIASNDGSKGADWTHGSRRIDNNSISRSVWNLRELMDEKDNHPNDPAWDF